MSAGELGGAIGAIGTLVAAFLLRARPIAHPEGEALASCDDLVLTNPLFGFGVSLAIAIFANLIGTGLPTLLGLIPGVIMGFGNALAVYLGRACAAGGIAPISVGSRRIAPDELVAIGQLAMVAGTIGLLFVTFVPVR